jgi:acyl-CoA synthetase (AMP-forming)/AMP-acid ligase II
MIIRGGENIAPVAIERALLAIPGVADAAVFGVPHPDLGEEVMAVVAIDREVTVPELEAHLRKGIASFSVPSRWKLQTMALPTNDAGKIDKKTLRAQVLAGATAPGN